MDTDSPPDTKSKVALVSGATGFIGSHLVHQLYENGYDVVVLSRQPYSSQPAFQVNENNWMQGNLNDPEALLAACQRADIVFHIAGLAHSNSVDRNEVFSVNLHGTKNIYSASAAAGVKKFIFFSSILASTPSVSAYAESKRAAEEFLLAASSERRKPEIIILRPPNVYGPGMRGNLRTFIQLTRKKYIPSLPKLENPIPLVSVYDICLAAIFSAQGHLSVTHGKIYEVTDGECYTPSRIESAVYECVERNAPRWRVPRVFLFIAAVVAQFVSVTRLKPNQMGLRLYRNLVGVERAPHEELISRLKLTPTATLESEMQSIIKSFDAE